MTMTEQTRSGLGLVGWMVGVTHRVKVDIKKIETFDLTATTFDLAESRLPDQTRSYSKQVLFSQAMPVLQRFFYRDNQRKA